MQNRLFFPQSKLDEWMVDGAIDLQGARLTLLQEGRDYHVVEALHVTKELSGSEDPLDVVGRVKSRLFFTELGAEIIETSMLIGDNAYEVVPGWMGTGATLSAADGSPLSDADAENGSLDDALTDEDLLAQYLLKTLS